MPLILVPFWVLLCGCLAITARDNVRGIYMGLFSLFRKDSKYNLYKAELDKYEQVFSNQAYPKLKSDMLDHLKSTDLTDVNNEELPWETYALYGIINVTGDLLEGGNYHIYRGVLNPTGEGPDLLKLYDFGVDLLVQKGLIDKGRADGEKNGLRQNIKNVG